MTLRRVLLLSIVLLSLSGCPRTKCVPPAPLDTADIVVGSGAQSGRPFGVDLCIDATPSMEGFAAPEGSIYRSFLDDLEGSLVSGVKNVSDVRFYKFGERIRQVTRDEFRSARTARFYHEPGIFRTTDIELVFQKPSEETRVAKPLLASATAARADRAAAEQRVTVVVTDLFQRDQDVNAVVRQIKSRCLSDPDCSVGLLAIPSEFDGTVYDARVPSYRYRSTADAASYRPFYLLMFGPEEELRTFADVLSARKYVDLRRFTVIGRRTVAQFSAETKRDPAAKGVTNHAWCGSKLDAAFNLQRGHDEALIKTLIRVVPDAEAFGFDPARAVVRVFREEKGARMPAPEVTTTSVARGLDGLEIAATIRPPQAKADHLYVFEVATGEVNGFVLPKWIAAFSSADPRPERDAARTLNLDRFVEQLIATSVLDDHHQPTLARYRVLIHKQ